MTKYIKTGTTESEQFDGSDEMMDKYVIEEWPYEMARPDYSDNYFVIKTLEGNVFFAVGDWIATGVEGEHWPVKDEIFKRTYKKLPLIPECVAQFIKRSQPEENLLSILIRANFHQDNANLWKWIFDHPDEFARAWLDGYEVAEVEE